MCLPIRFLSRSYALAALLFCISGIGASPCLADSASTTAARELAQKIEAQLDSKQTLHVEFRDLTNSLGAAEINEAERAFETEISSRGIRLSPTATAQIDIKVTFSSDSESRLWVAEYVLDSRTMVAIVNFAMPISNSGAPQSAIAIRRQLVFSQPELILDFAFAGQASDTNTPLVILSSGSISVMRFRDKAWQLHAMDLLQFAAATPRDLQGKLSIAGSNFEARLANIICTGIVSDVGATHCNPAPGIPWEFSGANGKSQLASAAAGRNWFTWSNSSGANSSRPPFFSVAGFGSGDLALWAAANIDGEVRVYEESVGDSIGTATGFGSQIAGVQTACGTGWQILTTSKNDYSGVDAVQAQEWTGREFRSVSAAMEFEGPILALRRGSEGNSVRAMVHNLKNGMYEAYVLNIDCNR